MDPIIHENYFCYKKILRDLTHQYINLTQFDIELIDSPQFQRLKDIRQLTCQHVYPCARHTRFEHSLGVMELTRRAIKEINKNGYLTSSKLQDKSPIIPQYMEFSTSMAALLHDVGHTPFSHLGEAQLDKNALKRKFLNELYDNDLLQLLCPKAMLDPTGINYQVELPGAPHEWLSCIVILQKFGKKLKVADQRIRENANTEEYNMLEHIIRCVIGLRYEDPHDIKNITISLVNSETLDMDKLDYIMRDSLYTGVSVPGIDTMRLFHNMFVSLQNQIIFTSKAVPVLQTIIETRDNLYLWVYNHHTTVYTDFIYYYILRRLNKNFKSQILGDENSVGSHYKSFVGAISKESLFSVKAILEDLVSDSDMIYLLSSQNRQSGLLTEDIGEKEELDNRKRALNLIFNIQSRKLLKPWWKTVYEYQSFMNSKFMDDSIRHGVAEWACGKKDQELAPEFRSMIAKCVIALSIEEATKQNGIEKALSDGDFFMVERSNKFYHILSIEKIIVYLKRNEILNVASDIELTEGDYYGKKLTKLIPQRDYSSILDSDSFYLYLAEYAKEESESCVNYEENRRHFYDKVERLFLTVASKLGAMSVQEFKSFLNKYDGDNAQIITKDAFR